MGSEPDRDEVVLPVAVETARVERVARETGRVRVTLSTEALPQQVTETLRSESVEVERVPVNRTLLAGESVPQPRQEPDGTWIIPVLEEVLVVETRLRLVEEVRLVRQATEEEFREVVTLRRQRAEVERLPPGS